MKDNEQEVCQILNIVGRGGALVETMTFNRRVVGATPALAATYTRTLGKSFIYICLHVRFGVELRYSIRAVYSRERLGVVEDLKGRYRNGRNE